MLEKIFTANIDTILISKAIAIIAVGILTAYLLKHAIRKILDKVILKKLFKKSINTYETSKTLVNVITEILQWTLIAIMVNYSLVLLNFNFLASTFSFIVKEIPKISIFTAIIVSGIIISKIISEKIKKSSTRNKEEISLIIEIVVSAAFILSALEYIGIRATAILELFKVILYILAAIIIIIIIRPNTFKK